MNPWTGQTWPSLDAAVKDGQDPDDIVEVTGSPAAVEQLRMVAQAQAKRGNMAKRRKQMQKASRKANRR